LIGMHEGHDGIRTLEHLTRPHWCGIIARVAEELWWCRVMRWVVRPGGEVPRHPQAGGDRYRNNDHPRRRGLRDAQRHIGRGVGDNEAQYLAPVEFGPLQLRIRFERIVVVHAVAMPVEELHIAEDHQPQQKSNRHEAHPHFWQARASDDDERPHNAEGPTKHRGRLMLRVVALKLLLADLEHPIRLATGADTISRDAGYLPAGEVMTRWGTGFSLHPNPQRRCGSAGAIQHT